jgi:hypothetical protein
MDSPLTAMGAEPLPPSALARTASGCMSISATWGRERKDAGDKGVDELIEEVVCT